ncbi:small ribosomal subunit Rsm22 family protein [Streptomyces sp. NPDC127079]|uniref:small ribosomal subunit Rsm22 family protein n=1 Tax=Streptomyces sp. NPDC127079 TaxID=3347132 RepID=UPI00364B1219
MNHPAANDPAANDLAAPADRLRATLGHLLDGLPPRQAAGAVERLIANYRGATPTDAPILRDRADVVAYAAYRMPATFEAVRSALAEFADTLPEGWAPDSHVDVGGGTGAATWAVTDTWAGVRPVTVLDWAEPALALGREIAAPCPHSAACPIVPGTDWCHFSARVSRSSLHRQVKGGSLPYEDEKFSYVAATRLPAAPAPSRVVRRPQIRKGQVLLDLCEPDEHLRRTTVTKRHGDLYRAARDVDWGDPWPPG